MDGNVNREGSYDARHAYPSAEAAVELRQSLIDVPSLLRIVWRRKWVLILCVALALAAAALIVSQLTPRYDASAQVMLNTRGGTVVDVESVIKGFSANSSELESEVQIIQSAKLIERVVSKLRLNEDPEFNASLREPSALRASLNPKNWIKALAPPELLAAIGMSPEQEVVVDEELDAERRRRAVMDAVRKNMSVAQVNLSYVIQIGFSSSDARKAALIANTIADEYIVDQFEAKYEATQRATGWLSERVRVLKDRVESAEQKVEEYKAAQVSEYGQDSEITSQQIQQLNAELSIARAELAQVEARFNQIRTGATETSVEVLSSPLVQRLREQEAEVLRKRAELSTRYGDRHPAMIDVNKELQDIRTQISLEASKIVEGVRNELTIARARVSSLRDQLGELTGAARIQSQSDVKLRQLEREAQAARLIYENFLSRFKEISEQQEIQQPDARLISEAQAPNNPSAPQKSMFLALAGVFGGFIGLGVIFLLESFSNTFRSEQEFELATGVRVIASIPRFGRRKRSPEIMEYVWERPNSALAEAVRNLRTSLLLANVDTPPKVVMITSSIPSEGKSTLAMLLALTTARMGKRAIVLDCDLRRPTLRNYYPGDHEGTVTNVVSGQQKLEDAVIVDPRDKNLHALVASVAQTNPADILSSRRFAELIEKVRGEYDFVVIDAPPTLAVTDARIIGQLVDLALFVCRWDATPRHAAQQALRQLSDVSVPVAGTAMTMVDLERQQHYGYGSSRSYYVDSQYYDE